MEEKIIPQNLNQMETRILPLHSPQDRRLEHVHGLRPSIPGECPGTSSCIQAGGPRRLHLFLEAQESGGKS